MPPIGYCDGCGHPSHIGYCGVIDEMGACGCPMSDDATREAPPLPSWQEMRDRAHARTQEQAWEDVVGDYFDRGRDGDPLVLVSASFSRGSMLSLENGLEIPATILKIVGRPPGQLIASAADQSFVVFLNDTQMLYLSLMFLTEYGKRALPETPEEPPGG